MSFSLRLESRRDFAGNTSWMAHVVEIANGEEVHPKVVITGNALNPLDAITNLATKQAAILSGYRDRK